MAGSPAGMHWAGAAMPMLTVLCVLLALATLLPLRTPTPAPAATPSTPARPADAAVKACDISRRAQHLWKKCQDLQLAPPANSSQPLVTPATAHLFKYLLADDRNRLLYCVIPKTGSTSWKNMIFRSALNGSEPPSTAAENHFSPRIVRQQFSVHYPKFLRKYGFHFLYQDRMSLAGMERRLRTYYKMVVVRHPLRRLLSAFLNKFVDHVEFPGVIKGILRQQGLAGERELISTQRVNFTAFAAWVTSQGDARANEHWATYERLCQPCLVRYDFIARLETVERDQAALRARFGFAAPLPHLNPSQVTPDSRATWRAELEALDGDTLQELVRHYQHDLRLFGYGVGTGGEAICELEPGGCC